MSKELEGQLAIVTGAARGIGEAVSKQLASMGARVVLVARDAKQLDRVKTEIVSNGGDAEAIPADLLDEASIKQLAQQIESRFHRCDVIVNNAGIGILGKPLYEMLSEEWDQLMGTNLRGPYLMIRAFAPLMIAARSGHIVNISSLAGHNALANGAAYAASKSGLNSLTYSVAEELRQFNIRVSVLAPGSVNTSFSPSDSAKNPDKKVQPSDVARVVAMSMSEFLQKCRGLPDDPRDEYTDNARRTELGPFGTNSSEPSVFGLHVHGTCRGD